MEKRVKIFFWMFFVFSSAFCVYLFFFIVLCLFWDDDGKIISLTDLCFEAKKKFEKKFSRKPIHCAYAPGRVVLSGEHVDYNDGFVLPVVCKFLTFINEVDEVSMKFFACCRLFHFTLSLLAYHPTRTICMQILFCFLLLYFFFHYLDVKYAQQAFQKARISSRSTWKLKFSRVNPNGPIIFEGCWRCTKGQSHHLKLSFILRYLWAVAWAVLRRWKLQCCSFWNV